MKSEMISPPSFVTQRSPGEELVTESKKKTNHPVNFVRQSLLSEER